MKHVKTKLLIVSLAAVFSASAMAGDPGPKFPDLDIDKICKPFQPPAGGLWVEPPYPYNLICHPK
ncbi:hypothetical protein AIA08_003087 [Salmonella enterica subsp. enterica serovar Wichita]|nr:hypothetical protein [Salmonella enterica subsp. enterica serovar Wichita]